jgi:two-component system cell cycle response regulator
MSARILAVDDVEFNLKLLDTKLKQHYYQVFTATNGIEAIKKAKELKPDIILMDVMMPEMDGIEATRILKSDPHTSFIPIVVITALNAQEDKVKCLEAGADDFLVKPINDHDLMTRIRLLVRLKSLTDELRLRELTDQQLGITTVDVAELSNFTNTRLLMIDDDAKQVKLMQTKLQTIGVALDTCVTGAEAMQMLKDNKYTGLIISTLLFEEDGLRICSDIKANNEFKSLPLIIVVDENDPRSLDLGFEIGISDYIISPIDPNEALARCITQMKRFNYESALKKNLLNSINNSYKDALTNANNRRYFETHGQNLFNQAKAEKKPLCLAMLDIDNFKEVNDKFGHPAGDAILKEFASRIQLNLRMTDLTARFGGEEFVVLLPNTNLDFGKLVAERLRACISEADFLIPAEPGKITKTTSVGLALANEDDTLETLLARADKALYTAKNSGKNQVVVA